MGEYADKNLMADLQTNNPIESLMQDPDITEIMVNRYNLIFVEKRGLLYLSNYSFKDPKSFYNYVIKMLRDNGCHEKDGYYFDGAFSGVFRYNIVLPPMNPSGPVLTIRKFGIQMFTLDTLVDKGSITERVAYFLEKIVKSRMNVIVSGGTGSGKTTFLQALSSEIPPEERIVTIEDVSEIKLHQKNWVQLISVSTDDKVVSIKDCLINSLRMRPDRIIVGECRRDETFEMLQAMNTGHEGSMTTIHANASVDCLTRMENLLHSSGFDIDNLYLRRQIAETIDFIIQLGRTNSGGRIVTEVIELTGTEGDMITRNQLFERDRRGQLVSTGLVPKTVKEIERKTGSFSPSFFVDDGF